MFLQEFVQGFFQIVSAVPLGISTGMSSLISTEFFEYSFTDFQKFFHMLHKNDCGIISKKSLRYVLEIPEELSQKIYYQLLDVPLETHRRSYQKKKCGGIPGQKAWNNFCCCLWSNSWINAVKKHFKFPLLFSKRLLEQQCNLLEDFLNKSPKKCLACTVHVLLEGNSQKNSYAISGGICAQTAKQLPETSEENPAKNGGIR